MHFLIITLLRIIPGVATWGVSEGALTLLLSLLVAWLLTIGIANPVEKLRQAQVARLRTPTVKLAQADGTACSVS